MFARVAVLEDDVERLEVVDDEREGSVRLRDGRVLAERELGEDGGHLGVDERLVVEHGAVRAVVEGVEEDLERDLAAGGQDGLDVQGHERGVVCVVVQVDGTEVGDRLGRVVGDGARDVWDGVRNSIEDVERTNDAYWG